MNYVIYPAMSVLICILYAFSNISLAKESSYINDSDLSVVDDYMYHGSFFESSRSMGLEIELFVYENKVLVRADCSYTVSYENKLLACLKNTQASALNWLDILNEEGSLPSVEVETSEVKWKLLTDHETISVLQMYDIDI